MTPDQIIQLLSGVQNLNDMMAGELFSIYLILGCFVIIEFVRWWRM
jgi:hypothetical protein